MDKKPSPQPERVVLSESLIELSRLGVRCWRNNTGALKDEQGRLVKFGLKGSSDIIGVHSPSGRIVCVECKSTGKKVKPNSEQDNFLSMIRNQGGIAFECDDSKKIKKLLDEQL